MSPVIDLMCFAHNQVMDLYEAIILFNHEGDQREARTTKRAKRVRRTSHEESRKAARGG